MIAYKNDFDAALASSGARLSRVSPEILQLNTGKLCNLTCLHCHVNAGPKRKEIITRETIDQVLNWFEKTDISTLDLTGGTPEMIPDFRYLVESVRSFEKPRKIMTRLNATIVNEPGYEWVPEFHKKHEVEIIASMPCYCPKNVNEQRGEGVFDSSIKAFQQLNKLGYGRDENLILNFVYNPNGAYLPPEQKELEQDYKIEMKKHFDIDFNKLYCITNIPISRFASYLKREKKLEEYMQLLRDSYNPATVHGLMCRDTISVSWKGNLYDCDFNQMLEMHSDEEDQGKKLWDLELDHWMKLPIRTGNHCFGCTAGSGSSCGGVVV